MSMMSYCPKCGNTYFGEGICSYCGEKYILTKYTSDEYYDDVCKYEQKILEEYVKKSPKFNEELFNKRKEKENAIIHGRGTPVNTQQQNIPKCPTCGSTNVQKLSTTSKVVGLGLLGLASKTVGKTYKCKNCG